MSNFTAFVQLAAAVIVGMYFFTRIRTESADSRAAREESKVEAEKLNALRRIHLSEPMTEMSRPGHITDIIGQEDGIRALRSALWGAHPQHVLIYGPPGVGKTAAARVVMEEVKKSPGTRLEKMRRLSRRTRRLCAVTSADLPTRL